MLPQPENNINIFLLRLIYFYLVCDLLLSNLGDSCFVLADDIVGMFDCIGYLSDLFLLLYFLALGTECIVSSSRTVYGVHPHGKYLTLC